jgi:hypothetical protein
MWFLGLDNITIKKLLLLQVRALQSHFRWWNQKITKKKSKFDRHTKLADFRYSTKFQQKAGRLRISQPIE